MTKESVELVVVALLVTSRVTLPELLFFMGPLAVDRFPW